MFLFRRASAVDDPESHFAKAEKLSESGNISEAIAEYSAAIKLDAKKSKYLLGRADAYNRLKQYSKAIEDMHLATSLSPEDGALYNCRGFAYLKTKWIDQAKVDFRKAIELRHRLALENYAALCLQVADLDNAIEYAREAIDAFPERKHGYRVRAEALHEKWLQLHPKEFRPTGSETLQLAVQDCSKAFSLDHTDYKSLTLRGLCKRDLGDGEGARSDFEAALAIMPSYTKAQAALYQATHPSKDKEQP